MFENLLDRSRYDTSLILRVESLHRVRLSRTRLTVRKNSRVVSLEGRFYHTLCRVLEHGLLRRVLIVHMIERERVSSVRLRIVRIFTYGNALVLHAHDLFCDLNCVCVIESVCENHHQIQFIERDLRDIEMLKSF